MFPSFSMYLRIYQCFVCVLCDIIFCRCCADRDAFHINVHTPSECWTVPT